MEFEMNNASEDTPVTKIVKIPVPLSLGNLT